VLTGALLLEKLVPLIPPTYANLTRFHGVFAPTSRLRAKVRRSRCSKTTEVHMHWRPRGAASWRSPVDAVTFDGRSLITAGPGGFGRASRDLTHPPVEI
jgi:hypothetical protein